MLDAQPRRMPVFSFFATILLSVLLCPHPAVGQTYRVGDRVQVSRGGELQAGTVVGGRGTRVTVKLDDDGSFAELDPATREKRLTRNFYASDLSPATGAAANPPPASRPPSPTVGAAPTASSNPFGSGGAERRTWSDQSGRFSIDATYRGMNGGKVVLEKTDGSRIEVPLDKLSQADQEYVDSQGGDANNPFAVPSTMAGGLGVATVRAGDLSTARTLSPRTFEAWTFVPKSSGAVRGASANTRPVRLAQLPRSKAFFEDVLSLNIASTGKRAIVARKTGNVGGDQPVYLEFVDLDAGRSLGLAPLPPNTEVLDVDVDRGLVAYQGKGMGEEEEEITVARLQGAQLVPMAAWRPYDNGVHGVFKDVDSAKFLGNGQIATTNFHSDELTLWDPATAKATLQIPVSSGFRGERLACSPDGRYVALDMRSGIAIVDVVEGEHVATIEVGDGAKGAWDRLAFSDDNSRLASLNFHRLTVWDLNSGKTLETFHHETMSIHDDLCWAGEFVLYDNRFLYDYKSRVLLWEFEGTHFNDGGMGGGLLALLEKDRERGMPLMQTFAIPNAQMIAQAEELRAEGSLVVARAGDPVSVKLDIDENVISSQTVREAVIRNLQAAGYVVAEGSDVVVTAVCKRLEPRTISVSDFHAPSWNRGRNAEQRTITPCPSSLAMSYKGQAVWRQSNMGAPGSVFHLRKGESLDDALARLTTPNTQLLTDSDFPSEIIRPGKATSNGAYGVTNLQSGASGTGGRFE